MVNFTDSRLTAWRVLSNLIKCTQYRESQGCRVHSKKTLGLATDQRWLLDSKICCKNFRPEIVLWKSRFLIKILNGETLIKDAHSNVQLTWRNKNELLFLTQNAHHFLTVLPFSHVPFLEAFFGPERLQRIVWLWRFWHWPPQVSFAVLHKANNLPTSLTVCDPPMRSP